MKNALVFIAKTLGWVVVLLFCIVGFAFVVVNVTSQPSIPRAEAQSSESSDAFRQASQPTHTSPPAHDYCDDAMVHEQAASKDGISHQASYNTAVAGLSDNEQCSDEDEHLINEGFLLSMKGLAEHYLKDGDSRTDLNQANALLVKCQTTPGLYGTKLGATCETQEQNNIRASTNWDIYGG